jgi:O-antigen/teichoic acid export membrane protein
LEVSAKKLIKGTSIYTIAQLFTKSGSILLLPVFTRLLTPEEYGIIGLLNPIISFIPLFFVFGLYVAQMRNHIKMKDNLEKWSGYIFTLNLFLWVVNLLIFVFLVSPFGIKTLGYIIDYDKVSFYPYVVITLIIGFINVFNLMAKNYFQTLHKFKKIGISSILSFLISSISAVMLIYYFNLGALGKLIGNLLGVLFIFIFLYLNYIKNTKINFLLSNLKSSLYLGVPVVANSIVGTIINYSDRIVLANYLTMDIVGIYSLAYTGGMVLLVFNNSFMNAWTPMFYNLLEGDNKRKFKIIKKTFTSFILASSFICLIGSMFGRELIYFFLPLSYNRTVEFLPYVLVGMVFSGVVHFLGKFFIYFNESKFIPIISVFSAMINLSINILYIPKHGAIVAAISTIISYVFTSLLMLIIIRIKYKDINFEYIKIVIIIFILLNPLTLFLYNASISLNTFIIKIIYLFIFIIIFLKEIKFFYNRILKR